MNYTYMKLLVFFLPGVFTQNFTILRGKTEPDKIVNLYEIKRDEASFDEDGSCLGAKKNIASQHHDQKLQCYAGPELAHLGNEYCGDGFEIVTDDVASLSSCRFSQILSLNVWTPNEWRELTSNSRSKIYISAKRLVLEDRRKWDGLLSRIFVRCGSDPQPKCFAYKFTGIRSYPLPVDPNDIWKVSTYVPTTKTNVQHKRTSSGDENSSNTGMVAGVVLTCLLIAGLVAVLGFLYIRRLRRRRDIHKRRDPSVYTSTTVDVQFKRSDTNEEKVAFQPAPEYAIPSSQHPEYCQLEPFYNDGSDRLQPVRKGNTDVSENEKEELIAAGYKAPSVTSQSDEEKRALIDSGIYQEPSSPIDAFVEDKESPLVVGYKTPSVNDPEIYDTPIYESHESNPDDKRQLYAKVNKDRK